MNAEPAAAAGDTAGTESQATDTSSDANQNPNEGLQPDASSARVAAILQDEGFPEEEVEEVVKPKDQPNAEEKETSRSAELPERKDGDRGVEGPAKSESGDRKPESQQEKGEKEEPLTEEQKKSAPWALPRIHQLTAQKKELATRAETAERKAAELEQRLKGAARPVVQPTAESPLADVDSPEGMEAAIKEYRDLREWAQQNPDGLTDVVIGKDAEGKPLTRDYSAKEMAAIVAKTTRILDEHVPARVQLLSQQYQHEQVAREKMPALFQEGTEENQFMEAAKREVPGITSIPGFANWIRWAWMGRLADIEAGKAATDGKNGKDKSGKVDSKVAVFLQKHPPLAPGVPAARVQEDRKTGETVKKAQERVEAGEGEDADVDLVAALREEQAEKGSGVLV